MSEEPRRGRGRPRTRPLPPPKPLPEDRDPESGQFLPGNAEGEKFLPGNDLSRKFRLEFIEQARKLARLGANMTEIADFFEVGVVAIYRWRHEYEEFAEALKVGGELALDRVETSIFQRATGYDYTEEQAIKVKTSKDTERVEVVEVRRHVPSDTLSGVKLLSAKGRDEWRERKDVNVSGTIRHVSPEQARRELLEFLEDEERNGELIEGKVLESRTIEPEPEDF